MSTQVTIQRTFTTTTTSALLVNVGYLKTLPGLLKVFQILLGCIAVGIIGHYITWTSRSTYLVPELFFLLIATACLITTTLLLFSCIFSIATASILPKTLFETVYHIMATILYGASGITLLVYLNDRESRYGRDYLYEVKTAASVVFGTGALCYLLFCSSVNLLKEIVKRNEIYTHSERGYSGKLTAGAIGLVNTALYLLSTLYSVKSFRRG